MGQESCICLLGTSPANLPGIIFGIIVGEVSKIEVVYRESFTSLAKTTLGKSQGKSLVT